MPPSAQVKGCRLGPGGQSLPHAGSRVAQAAPGGSPLRGAPARDPARAPRRACSGRAAAVEVPRGRQVASRSIPRPRLRARTATPQAARLRGPESPGTPRRPGLSAAGRRGRRGAPADTHAGSAAAAGACARPTPSPCCPCRRRRRTCRWGGSPRRRRSWKDRSRHADGARAPAGSRTPSTVPQPRTPPSRLPPARCPQQVARGEGAEGESSGCSDAGGCTRGQSQAPTLSTRRESGLWTTRQPAARGFERQSWGPSTRAGLPGRNRGGLSGGALTGLTEEGEAGLHPGTQDR